MGSRSGSSIKANEKKKEKMRKELASNGKPIPKKLEAIEDYKPKPCVDGAKAHTSPFCLGSYCLSRCDNEKFPRN